MYRSRKARKHARSAEADRVTGREDPQQRGAYAPSAQDGRAKVRCGSTAGKCCMEMRRKCGRKKAEKALA
eukprot:4474246-Prymnesium_polylepis.1